MARGTIRALASTRSRSTSGDAKNEATKAKITKTRDTSGDAKNAAVKAKITKRVSE